MDLAERLIAIQGDPALIEHYGIQNAAHIELIIKTFGKKRRPPPGPAPDWSKVKTMQLTIYDNHTGGKVRGTRWGIGIKLWTTDVADLSNPDWEASSYLWFPKNIKKELRAAQKKTLASPLSENGKQEFLSMVQTFPQYQCFGIMKHFERQRGKFTHEGHYIAMKFDYGKPSEVFVFLPGMEEMWVSTDIARQNVGGRPMTAKSVGQVRWSRSEHASLRTWVFPKRDIE